MCLDTLRVKVEARTLEATFKEELGVLF